MKAVILAGGRATRLEPLTLNTPKALIPVLNVPFIEYLLRNIAGYGIKEIVLALGHMARPFKERFGNGKKLGIKLIYSVEETPLGSAGAARLAEQYLDETFLVFNGDNFIDLDVAAMLNLHKKEKAKVTIALTRVDDPTKAGMVETDKDGRVSRFLEKPKPEEVTTNAVNAGAWLVEPEVMLLVPKAKSYSFERDVFPELLKRGEPIYAFISDGYWMDAGTPEKYLQLHRDLLSNKSSQYTTVNEVIIGENSIVHPTASLTGPVVIGSNCSIGPGVTLTGPVVIGNGCAIGENSVIEDSILWENIRLGLRVSLRKSIIAHNCVLNESSSGEGIVLGDGVTVTSNVTLEAGSRLLPGASV